MATNLEWFRTFRAIYETGSMSGAARELYISQPGVGLHLNALEAYTGFPLFERTGRRMIPTEKGSLLYQQTLSALNSLEDIETRFKRKPGNNKSGISIGMCIETFQHILEKHIPALDFNLIMQFGSNDKLLELLESGSVDLIVTSETNTCKSLTFNSFTTEKFILVAGRRTDVSGFQKSMEIDDTNLTDWLRNQIWYSSAGNMLQLNRFWESNLNSRPDFVPNYIVPNNSSIKRCLVAGEGLAILPNFICKDAIDLGDIIQLWEGKVLVEDTLYFGKRKQPIYLNEINHIERILNEEFLK